MGKQAAFLKNIAHPATMGGRPDAALGVEKHRPVDDDASPFRADQPGDRIDDRGLACSRAAKQRGETAPAAKMDVELESAEPVLDIDLKDRAHSGSCRALPKPATRGLSRTASMWSGVKPGSTITKTYNLEAGAGGRRAGSE
jgi:hypothetical protein